MLVDSEDDDEEEKGEEDAVSGSKYELVNGSSAPAAYLSCLAGGEPCCPLWGRSSAELWVFGERLPGGRNPSSHLLGTR